METLAPILTTLADTLGGVFETLGPVIAEVLASLQPVLEQLGGVLGETLASIATTIADLFTALAPTITEVAGLLGGSLSATALATKMTARAAANTSPEPFSNWGLSFLEDGLVAGLVWLALQHPVWFGVALVLVLAVSVLLLVVLFKFLRAVSRRVFFFLSEPAKVV